MTPTRVSPKRGRYSFLTPSLRCIGARPLSCSCSALGLSTLRTMLSSISANFTARISRAETNISARSGLALRYVSRNSSPTSCVVEFLSTIAQLSLICGMYVSASHSLNLIVFLTRLRTLLRDAPLLREPLCFDFLDPLCLEEEREPALDPALAPLFKSSSRAMASSGCVASSAPKFVTWPDTGHMSWAVGVVRASAEALRVEYSMFCSPLLGSARPAWSLEGGTWRDSGITASSRLLLTKLDRAWAALWGSGFRGGRVMGAAGPPPPEA
mmetsp:Transcript_37373/g.93783  ORF Transcript_37373/g.93783 Transcript_37373/m.93783 type:complete len:270 (+) Transcript_37373:89-898(+)